MSETMFSSQLLIQLEHVLVTPWWQRLQSCLKVVSWVAGKPSEHACQTSAEKHSRLDLLRRQAVKVVLGFICIANSPAPLERFIRAEVDSKSGRVSDEHALVPSEEAFESFSIVNAGYFLAVTHVLRLVVLSPYLQQVEYKGDVRVCESSEHS